jgi:hypothetical protein
MYARYCDRNSLKYVLLSVVPDLPIGSIGEWIWQDEDVTCRIPILYISPYFGIFRLCYHRDWYVGPSLLTRETDSWIGTISEYIFDSLGEKRSLWTGVKYLRAYCVHVPVDLSILVTWMYVAASPDCAKIYYSFIKIKIYVYKIT